MRAMKLMSARYALVLLAVLGGCKRKEATPAGGVVTTPSAAPSVPTQPVGSPDPFATLPSESAKLFASATNALKMKKPQAAVAALQNVVDQAPEYTLGRWTLIRALIMLDRFDDVVAAYEPLIARDYVGYADKLDKGSAYAALRAAPQWAKIQELKGRYRTAYAAGLDSGFFFVARMRAASETRWSGRADGGAATTGEGTLDLKQEVFHYDPASKRYRRLTDSDGHAFAINRAPDGKTLSFLVAGKLARENGVDAFKDPRLGTIELATLTAIGPFVDKGSFDQVGLGTNKSGQPMFTLIVRSGVSAAFTFDTARTGLAPLSGDAVIPQGGETRAWPSQVAHFEDKAVPGVKIEDGATQFLVDGVAEPVIAARPIAQSSLAWSPGGTKLTYAGKLDACKILKQQSKDKNELYVYDKQKRSAQRIAAAVSLFETLWLDDDRLVYESGVGKDGRIHIYTFSTHADETLPTKHGAGLYGVPTLACEQAESGIDEEINTDEEAGD
jgi:hypothetical protein